MDTVTDEIINRINLEAEKKDEEKDCCRMTREVIRSIEKFISIGGNILCHDCSKNVDMTKR